MWPSSSRSLAVIKILLIALAVLRSSWFISSSSDLLDDSLAYIWPLPAEFSSGNNTLSVDPALTLSVAGNGGGSPIVRAAFERYVRIIFKHTDWLSAFKNLKGRRGSAYDITKLKIVVHSGSEEVSWVLVEKKSYFECDSPFFFF